MIPTPSCPSSVLSWCNPAEVVEAACGIAPFMMGEMVENVATGIDCYSIRQPLGVVAGICPFNFPAMVPLWMFPMAVTSGNTFVLKPSEKDPGAAHLLAELAMQAGLPKWVWVRGGVFATGLCIGQIKRWQSGASVVNMFNMPTTSWTNALPFPSQNALFFLPS